MIDAYEIGIQLLLQDDVTAGLAVINRGLAEVDRAIAATSVNLTGLVHEAERATKAVAGAANGKLQQSASTGTVPAPVAAGDVRSRPAADVSSTESASVPVRAPVRVDGEQAAAPSKQVSVEDRPETPTAQIATEPQSPAPASAPFKAVASDADTSDQRAPAAKEDVISPTPMALGEKLSASSAPDGKDAREFIPAPAETRMRPTATRPAAVVTAAIGQARAIQSATTPRDRVGIQAGVSSTAGQERGTAAPWSAGYQAGPQSPSARLTERAAAPQSAGRDRADGGGGTVMLDGRLVGQWLSEHMAREASRPPGGTSFFDARQTPAWNVSGAL